MKYYELTESFDRVLRWQWDQKLIGFWTATFDIGDLEYVVSFDGDDDIEVAFLANENGQAAWGVTGSGNASYVFATVLDIVRKYIATEDPTKLYFDASLSEPSRVRLYRAMINRLKSSFPQYEASEKTISTSVVFSFALR